MSQVKEQYNSTFLSTDGTLNVTPRIGDMVRNIYNQNNVGVVIELIDNVQSKVLWNNFSSPWEGDDRTHHLFNVLMMNDESRNKIFRYSSLILRKIT